MQNVLTNQDEAYQTLVVNLPMINSTMHMPKDNPPSVAPHSKRQE
jgi:hypothetical protein